MAVETAADRAAFANPDEFGVTASYTAAGEAAVDIDGQFLNADEVLPIGEPGFVSASPEFHCPTESLPAGAAEDDTVVIASKTWRVATDPRDDGTGWSVLTLELS